MSSKPVSSSEDIRQKGNTLYKNGKVSEALLFYKRASELSPKETAPWSNISAAYFELGDYAQAISACDTALALLAPTNTDSDAAKQKLLTRKAKSCYFAGLYEDAGAVVDTASSSVVEIGTLSTGVQSYLSAVKHVEDLMKARHEIVVNLPRYKPTLINTSEYYAIGHDTPESLFDESLSSSPRQRISFLFGGIGDARNLFQSILDIAAHEGKAALESKSKKKDNHKEYYFTIVDIKSAAIARDLVILMLLDGLSEVAADVAAKAKKRKVLLCLFYTYLSSIMPSNLHEVLQEKIGETKTALEKGTLPPFIDIPTMYRAEIVEYLDDWQSKAQQEFPITRVQAEIVAVRLRSKTQAMLHGRPSGFEDVQPGTLMSKQLLFEAQTGALILPAPYNNLLDPGLREAYDKFDPQKPRSAQREAVKAIHDTWSTNPTLVDLPWERDREPGAFDVGDNPCTSCHKLMLMMFENGFRPRGAMPQTSWSEAPIHWFLSVAQALKQMRDRIKIEACVGDVTAVLEQIKYGAVGHRQQHAMSEPNAQALQPEGAYPQIYDRIHLSNVPDYIGGTLTSHLYALQMTHPDKTSFVTFTCLRNPPRFNAVASFDAEYVALYAEKDLEQAFHVRFSREEFPTMPMPMCASNRWYHQAVSREYKNLMPKAKLQTWLYRLFLKTALPVDKYMITDWELIYSPLNLTYFFRLCAHLHSIGYPAHWLSEVISNLLSGTITTTARPPRSEPLEPREIDAARKPLAQSVAPFTAELSTLAAMWQLLLPFGMLSRHIAPVESLRKYTIAFAKVSQEVDAYPLFILVFHKGTAIPVSHESNMRGILLSDEDGSEEHDHKEFRERRVNILSTWTWHRDSRTAMFWLREDEMRRMKEEGWQVCIFRSDNWKPQSGSRPVEKVEDLGVRWVDLVNGRV